jgi:hypothetical protein
MKAAQVEMLYDPDASPPGADHVDRVRGRCDLLHLGAHGGDRAGDFVDGLAAQPQAHQKPAHLRRRRLARHHVVEGLADSSRVSVAPVATLPMSALKSSMLSSVRLRASAGRHVPRGGKSRKFFKIVWPFSDAMLSG